MNVPLGLLAIAVVARVLPAGLGRSQGRETPLDLAGIAVLTGSLGSVLVGLNQHLLVSSLFAVRTGGLVLAGLLGLGLLVHVERRAASPILPLWLLAQPLTMRLLVTGTTATFGLYACVMPLPRYYQQTKGVSATRSGVFIYPLLLGLLVAVNVGAAVIAQRSAFRGTLLVANGTVALGALGFTAFHASSPTALPLVLMALIGMGVGPNLSGLQIAVQRTVAPNDLGAAMGALLLGRQVGGALPSRPRRLSTSHGCTLVPQGGSHRPEHLRCGGHRARSSRPSRYSPCAVAPTGYLHPPRTCSPVTPGNNVALTSETCDVHCDARPGPWTVPAIASIHEAVSIPAL